MEDKLDPAARPGAGSSADRPPLADLSGADQGSLSYLVLICFVATLGGLLFGYDTAVISGAIHYLEEYFALSAAMKGWAAASARTANLPFPMPRALVASGVQAARFVEA